MRRIISLLLLSPVFMQAQINRSANQLAKENVSEYLGSKIFKAQSYKPVSFGQLKPCEEKDRRISWSISHKFEITESEYTLGKAMSIQHPYVFNFYMDSKMKVLRAEAYYID
ncbi:MAG: hypothetical protein WDN26_13015 [Chitinophagaceae bacterium]